MHAHHHATAGLIIAEAALLNGGTPYQMAVLAAGGGFISHFVLDLLDEHDYGAPDIVFLEMAQLSLLAALALITLDAPLWLLAIGVVAANLPDIIDSNFYLTYVNRKRWPNRRWFICHYRGWALVQVGPAATFMVYFILLAALVWVSYA